jgi:hypothetical protein
MLTGTNLPDGVPNGVAIAPYESSGRDAVQGNLVTCGDSVLHPHFVTLGTSAGQEQNQTRRQFLLGDGHIVCRVKLDS